MTYQVRLSPSGRQFGIEANEPILSAGLSVGIKMPYGCRMGTCRSCRGRITSGQFDFGGAHPAYLPQSQRDLGFALLCQAHAKSDLEIEVEELPLLALPETLPALVKQVAFAAPDVAIVRLRLPLHTNLQFEAGQYVDFILGDGIRRSYSIANPPDAAGVITLEFHIRHLPGGAFTDRVFSHLKERDKIQLEAPLGTFLLRESTRPVLFVASGTGYAPVRSILMKELARGNQRSFILYWGGRSRKDLYLLDEVTELALRHPNFKFVPVLSEPLESDRWEGATGFVHAVAMQRLPDLSDMQVYACGAPLMVEAARRDFIAKCRLPESEFYSDAFLSRADIARIEGEVA